MAEIKLIIPKGGKVKILDKGKNAAAFTEKLAKELGSIEERHKGGHFEENTTTQNVEQH